ncbi:MAG: hypothetical protein PHF74_05565 [Dehalococcoidales bacterium]|nr:hypothetical protein [Dehalococcoidales bacterium]
MRNKDIIMLFLMLVFLLIFPLALVVFGYDIKGNLNVYGKATLMYLSETDQDDTTLFVADHQIVPKVYVDWKAYQAAGEAYPGSYPIIEGDLMDEAVTSLKIKDLTIVDSDISAFAGITATKIGGGLINNAEFSYLDGVTSNIQDQLDAQVDATYTETELAEGALDDRYYTETETDAFNAQLRAEMATDTELALKANDNAVVHLAGTEVLTGKKTLLISSDLSSSDTALVTDDAQIPTKAYVDWKATIAGGGGSYSGSYPIITGDLADDCVTSAKIDDGTIVDTDISPTAGIQASKINLSGLTWNDFN